MKRKSEIMGKYTTFCSCNLQYEFTKQLIQLVYSKTTLEDDEWLNLMDEFVNHWCPIVKDCPCKSALHERKNEP